MLRGGGRPRSRRMHVGRRFDAHDRSAPPAGFEPARTAPEAAALSPELRGLVGPGRLPRAAIGHAVDVEWPLARDDAVVLCTRNRPHEVATCLVTLAAQTAPATRVVVVDSSDDDATERVVEQLRATWPEGSRLDHVRSRPALTHQRAVGLARTRGALVHFVDDDVELAPEYLAAVRRTFAADDAIVGVGGFVANGARRPVRRLDEWLGLDARVGGRVLPSGRNVPLRDPPAGPVDVEWLSGCAMSYRRTVLEREPPNEEFPFEGEDVELSYRVGRHGRLVVTPAARVVHHESRSNRVSGVAQVEAELTTRYRRVVAERGRLSERAFWVSAYAQLVKYALAGAVTLSRRRLDIALGTTRAIRVIRSRARSLGAAVMPSG